MVANATQAIIMTQDGIVVFLTSNMMTGVQNFHLNGNIFSLMHQYLTLVFLPLSFPETPKYSGYSGIFRNIPEILFRKYSGYSGPEYSPPPCLRPVKILLGDVRQAPIPNAYG